MKSEKLTVSVYADTTATAEPCAYAYYEADPADFDGDFAADGDDQASGCSDDLSSASYDCDDLTDEIRRTIAELFMLLILSLWLSG